MISLKRVLISDPINPNCVKILQTSGIEVTALPKVPTKEELLSIIKDYEGLIVRSGTKVTKEVIQAGRNLKIIGRAGTGVDNIDVKAATEAGILVMNTPGGNTLSAAEHTCAMMMAVCREIAQSCESLKSGKWNRKAYMGTELNGKTLALVGLGRVGREVAIRMQAFGMTVIGYDPYVSPESAAASNIEFLPLEKMWPRADWISIHTPLLPSTKGMINEDVFNQCKKGVCIVNVARGGIIHDESLLKALKDGIVAGAGLDVFDNEPPLSDVEWEIIRHPKVCATPHLGANTKEAQSRVAEEIADQFVAMQQARSMVGLINGMHLAQVGSAQPWLDLAVKLGTVAGKFGQGVDVTITVKGSNIGAINRLLGIGAVVGIHNDPSVNLLTAESKLPRIVHEDNGPDILTIAVDGFTVSGKVEGTCLLLTNISGTSLYPPAPLAGPGIAIFAEHAFKKCSVSDIAGLRWMVSNEEGWTLTSSEGIQGSKAENHATIVTFSAAK
ncbi:unnamed protein product [Cyprideis torosa]|uniref:Uncharacterized protein n=1 Tax=Cyprideis torosa TaxID=163714 RepID=A0A7R8W614_9CRUS|nr:unnamed protein product [Cyprideis torosa]CAG0885907.1 unnamed protein product [Cyprideis torosa]